MDYTGFKVATGDTTAELGKWFREEDHGKTVPDFITERTFQSGHNGDSVGWKFTK